jgi:ribosomal protein L27
MSPAEETESDEASENNWDSDWTDLGVKKGQGQDHQKGPRLWSKKGT